MVLLSASGHHHYVSPKGGDSRFGISSTGVHACFLPCGGARGEVIVAFIAVLGRCSTLEATDGVHRQISRGGIVALSKSLYFAA